MTYLHTPMHRAPDSTALFANVPTPAPKLILTDDERRRLDESPDASFYATPRMMQHIDEAAVEALTGKAASPIPKWRSQATSD
jgi:hypothetical protein